MELIGENSNTSKISTAKTWLSMIEFVETKGSASLVTEHLIAVYRLSSSESWKFMQLFASQFAISEPRPNREEVHNCTMDGPMSPINWVSNEHIH